MKRLIPVLLMLIFMSVPVYADDLQDGIDAYKRKDYKTGLDKLKPLAEKGNAEAQYFMGEIHLDLIFEEWPKNKIERIKWLELSAKNGFPEGQSSLAEIYFGEFLGNKKNTKFLLEVLKWHRKAAEQGVSFSQYRLGNFLSRGEYVLQDLDGAKNWYLKAARQGQKQAQFEIGNMYSLGIGVSRDLNEARKWFLKSGENRNASSQLQLAFPRNQSFGNLENGDSGSQLQLGLMNYYGVGIPENMEKAFYWFDLAKKYNARAQIYLTQMYATGLGVAKDQKEGLKWLREAAGRGQHAEDGSPWAQFYLGQWYVNRDKLGLGGKFDFELAALWQRRAAEKGLYAAQQNMSQFYEQGTGVSKNIIKAYMWAYIGDQQDLHPKFRIDLRQSEEFWPTLIQGNGFDVDHVNEFYNSFSNMEEVKRNITPDQITEAQKLAREWMEEHQKN